MFLFGGIFVCWGMVSPLTRLLGAEGKTQTIVTNDNLYPNNMLTLKNESPLFLIKFLSADVARTAEGSSSELGQGVRGEGGLPARLPPIPQFLCRSFCLCPPPPTHTQLCSWPAVELCGDCHV